MNERYQRVFAISDCLYFPTSPLLITGGALYKDTPTDNMVAQLKMLNIDKRIIKAVYVELTSFDVAGKELGSTEYQYLDLEVRQDCFIGEQKAIRIPNKTARSFNIVIKQVVFKDGSVWEYDGKEATTVKEGKPLSQINEYDRKTYKFKYGEYCVCLATKQGELWQCTCGVWNRSENQYCHRCKKPFIKADFNELKKEYEAELQRQKDEAERIRQERIDNAKEKLETAKQFVLKYKIAIAAVLVAVIAIIVTVNIANSIEKKNRYNSAIELLEQEKYEEAIAVFAELEDYEDSRAKRKNAEKVLSDKKHIEEVIQCVNKGEFETAKKTINLISDAELRNTFNAELRRYQQAYENIFTLSYAKEVAEKNKYFVFEEDVVKDLNAVMAAEGDWEFALWTTPNEQNTAYQFIELEGSCDKKSTGSYYNSYSTSFDMFERYKLLFRVYNEDRSSSAYISTFYPVEGTTLYKDKNNLNLTVELKSEDVLEFSWKNEDGSIAVCEYKRIEN